MKNEIFHHSILLFLIMPDKIGLRNNFFYTLSKIRKTFLRKNADLAFFIRFLRNSEHLMCVFGKILLNLTINLYLIH